MIHITYNKEEAAVMNTTQLTINNISAELTGRVHMVINFVYHDAKMGSNRVDECITDAIRSHKWQPSKADERVIALACEWLPF